MSIAMTTSTAFPKSVSVKTRPSFFRSLLESMISAREAQAKRYVNGYLLSLEDDVLTDLGYDRDVIEREGSARFPF
ncbi:MAG: hypothetical protein C0606_14280 [Hyphomicrobiales bacterium]|nr:MAG: hypothetical protein C0606_14280 [Hyphomicrobiales bacterium]